MKTQLLCTFTNQKNLDQITHNITKNFNVIFDKIYVLQNEDNTKEFHAALTRDFGARHPQLSLISDTLPIISSADVIIKNLKKWMYMFIQ